MGFSRGFEKTAILGTAAKAIGRGIVGAGGLGIRAANKAFGSPLGTAQAIVQGQNTFSKYKNAIQTGGV